MTSRPRSVHSKKDTDWNYQENGKKEAGKNLSVKKGPHK